MNRSTMRFSTARQGSRSRSRLALTSASASAMSALTLALIASVASAKGWPHAKYWSHSSARASAKARAITSTPAPRLISEPPSHPREDLRLVAGIGRRNAPEHAERHVELGDRPRGLEAEEVVPLRVHVGGPPRPHVRRADSVPDVDVPEEAPA